MRVFVSSLILPFLVVSCSTVRPDAAQQSSEGGAHVSWQLREVEDHRFSRTGSTGLPSYDLRRGGKAPSTIGDADYQAAPFYYWQIDPEGVLRIFEYDREPVASLHLISVNGETFRVWNSERLAIESYRRTKLEPKRD